MALANDQGLQIESGATGTGGVGLNNNFAKISRYYSPKNLLSNPDWNFAQRQPPSTATGYSDDTYCADRWNVLTQTAGVQYNRQASPGMTTYSQFCGRFTQNQAAAQRHGVEQILESNYCLWMRGRSVRFQFNVRSSNTTTIRYAIVEWTGSADAVTSDFVLSWTSGTFTAGNFFTTTNTTVAGTSSTALTANTWSTCSIEAAVSTSMNNLAVIIWTDSTQAQSSTLDIGQCMLHEAYATLAASGNLPWVPPDYFDDLRLCQRYFHKNVPIDTDPSDGVVVNWSMTAVLSSTTLMFTHVVFPTEMFSTPTVAFKRTSNGASSGQWAYFDSAVYVDKATTVDGPGTVAMRVLLTTGALTRADGYIVKGCYTASAEL